MSWYPHTVTVAGRYPVTLAEAKAQCRVDSNDEDTLLDGLIAAATEYVELYCGTVIDVRTLAVKCDDFCDFAKFPVTPLATVTGITYVDSAGATQTLSTDVYEVRTDNLTASIVLKFGQSWPSIQSESRITVTATAGYTVAPAPIKQAILLLVGQWFDQRADVSDKAMIAMPNAVEALLTNYRTFA